MFKRISGYVKILFGVRLRFETEGLHYVVIVKENGANKGKINCFVFIGGKRRKGGVGRILVLLEMFSISFLRNTVILEHDFKETFKKCFMGQF